jgi:hypothetical protein
MKINRNNYESILIDYLEGNLSALAVAELLLFLEQHPDIKEEFESITGQNETSFSLASFGNKQSLKKFSSSTLVNEDNYTDFLIKRIERDLGELESSELEKFIGFYPPAQKDLLLFEKTILVADNRIVFENKSALKRSARIVPLFYQYAAAAAVLLALISLPFLLTPSGDDLAQNFSGNKHALEIKKSTMVPESVFVLPASTPAHLQHKKVMQIQPEKKETVPVQETLRPLPLQLAEIKKEEPLLLSPGKVETPAAIIIPAEVKNAAQDFPTLKDLALVKLKRSAKEGVIEENVPEQVNRKKFSAWDLAAITARVVNKATGNDIKLKKQYDDTGKLVEYGLVASNFEFSQSK